MNSEKTQITRKGVSAPTKWIIENYPLYGTVLHYGEGKAYHDTAALSDAAGVDWVFAYDPNSNDPEKRTLPLGYITDGNTRVMQYDHIVCNYVLNVLIGMNRVNAYHDIIHRALYSVITVRTDKVAGEPFADGVITKRGTFQTQLTGGAWVKWFKDNHPYSADRVKVLHQTKHYIMIEVR